MRSNTQIAEFQSTTRSRLKGIRLIGPGRFQTAPGDALFARFDFDALRPDAPRFGIPLPALDPETAATVFISNAEPVVALQTEHLDVVFLDDLLLGAIRLPASNIEVSTTTAYEVIFKTLSDFPGFRLIRLWNFLPAINIEEDGLERYRRFSRARHDVFKSAGYQMSDDLPAACAVGSQGEDLVIHFLAGKGTLTAIENPRQISAYRYPPLYGPKSPSFTRAMLHETPEGRQLFLSGTASIVGHETLHPGDALNQTEVTLDNVEALLAAAGYPPLDAIGNGSTWCIYVRDPSDLATIQHVVRSRLHPDAEVLYLEGDICRRDLVVEIEGTILS
jgi:chorismate lyase / 3-hydroxybenzoate synthase